jgi:hypothetical protein
MVESQPSKLLVASSILVSRSRLRRLSSFFQKIHHCFHERESGCQDWTG